MQGLRALQGRVSIQKWLRDTDVLTGYRRPRALLKVWGTRLVLLVLLALYAVAQGYALAILPVSFYLFVAAPLVVVLLVLIWALPTTDRPPVKLILSLFTLYPWIVFLWPNYLALSLGGLPWISLRRLILAPMAIAFLIALSMSPKFRSELWERTSAARPIAVAVLGFAIVQLLSIGLSSAPATSFKFMFDAQCAWTVVFFISCYAFARAGRIERWMVAMCVLLAILAAIGIAEWYKRGILWARYIPSFLSVDAESVKATLAGAERFGKYRVTGTSSQPLAFAEIFAVLSPFVLHFMFTVPGWPKKMALAGLDFAILLAITGTDSRLGFLGFGIAHFGYLFFYCLRRFLANRSALFPAAVVYSYPAVLGVAFILSLVVDGIRLRLWGSGGAQYSNDAREEQFRMAVAPFLRSPIIGHGPARSADVLGYVTQAGLPSVDSYVITIALEYGLVGFVCFFFMMGYGIYRALRIGVTNPDPRALLGLPLGIAVCVYLEVKLVLSQNDNTTLLFLLLGAITGLAYQLRPATSDAQAQPSRAVGYARRA